LPPGTRMLLVEIGAGVAAMTATSRGSNIAWASDVRDAKT
jgi:hypothetical protein